MSAKKVLKDLTDKHIKDFQDMVNNNPDVKQMMTDGLETILLRYSMGTPKNTSDTYMSVCVAFWYIGKSHKYE